MSNLKNWLVKRRGQVFEGETMRQAVDYFLALVEKGAEVHETEAGIVVLVPYGFPGNVKAYLLFDRFTKATATLMRKVAEGFPGVGLYAATDDVRVRNLLLKFGFTQYLLEGDEYFLVKRKGL